MNEKFIYWLLQNTSDLPEENGWLSQNERSLLQKMKFPKRRGEWRLGRWTAKQLLAFYFKIHSGKEHPFSAIEILPSKHGAPDVFLQQKPLLFRISISHRLDAGFCILQAQNHPIGCDLEIIESRSDAFIRDYFTWKEYLRVMRAPEQNRALLSNLIWSAKESILKVLQQGLKLDTRSVEINLGDIEASDSWKEMSAVSKESNQDFYGWWRLKGKYILTIFSTIRTERPLQM